MLYISYISYKSTKKFENHLSCVETKTKNICGAPLHSKIEYLTLRPFPGTLEPQL